MGQTTPTPQAIDFKPGQLLGSVSGALGLRKFLESRGHQLVVTSDNDHLIPKELSDLIAARIAGAKLVVMPGAGHIPFMEQPAEVVRIVLAFLEGLDG